MVRSMEKEEKEGGQEAKKEERKEERKEGSTEGTEEKRHVGGKRRRRPQITCRVASRVRSKLWEKYYW